MAGSVCEESGPWEEGCRLCTQVCMIREIWTHYQKFNVDPKLSPSDPRSIYE